MADLVAEHIDGFLAHRRAVSSARLKPRCAALKQFCCRSTRWIRPSSPSCGSRIRRIFAGPVRRRRATAARSSGASPMPPARICGRRPRGSATNRDTAGAIPRRATGGPDAALGAAGFRRPTRRRTAQSKRSRLAVGHTGGGAMGHRRRIRRPWEIVGWAHLTGVEVTAGAVLLAVMTGQNPAVILQLPGGTSPRRRTRRAAGTAIRGHPQATTRAPRLHEPRADRGSRLDQHSPRPAAACRRATNCTPRSGSTGCCWS